ncbi:hypothetical protein FC89_GL002115 [Liquorilactobacillus ghanensis DSM 18630]|uniref:Uncharacterized protein n=1 Tax=Liquorilactobacillus ghanensis DSM 18630 TaxID=1423750 RepID=A0A0R1VY65_9LACO|nr:hypothetical protein FC89_GL002115 [Liquorilactobacillus ghanensis DSM 18630]
MIYIISNHHHEIFAFFLIRLNEIQVDFTSFQKVLNNQLENEFIYNYETEKLNQKSLLF